jgi:hypothetical protein
MVAEQSHPLPFRLLRFARNDIIRLVEELKKQCPILIKLTAFGGTFLATLPIFAIITNSCTNQFGKELV